MGKLTSFRAPTYLLLIVLFAFVIRLGYGLAAMRHITDAQLAWTQGLAREQGLVAKSIVSGNGFGSPKGGDTGPTAMYSPVYPYLLAGVFSIFGVYTRQSAIAMLVLNGAWSAITTAVVFVIGERLSGVLTGFVAAALWAVFPAVIAAASLNWTQALSGLLIALIVWWSLQIGESGSAWMWAGYGLLWAFSFMVNPAIFAAFPFIFGWLVYKRRTQGKAALWLPALAALAVVLGCAPWTARNYLTFHKWIPFRSSFGFELWLGNNDRAPESWHGGNQLDPGPSPAELVRFERLGEPAYLQEKQQEAVRFIVSHPRTELRYTALRIVEFWFGAWYMPIDWGSWATTHWPLRIILLSNTVLPLLAFTGMYALWPERRDLALPLFVFVLFFPIVYYLTHAHTGYRNPIDPILVLFAAAGGVQVFRAATSRNAAVREC